MNALWVGWGWGGDTFDIWSHIAAPSAAQPTVSHYFGIFYLCPPQHSTSPLACFHHHPWVLTGVLQCCGWWTEPFAYIQLQLQSRHTMMQHMEGFSEHIQWMLASRHIGWWRWHFTITYTTAISLSQLKNDGATYIVAPCTIERYLSSSTTLNSEFIDGNRCEYVKHDYAAYIIILCISQNNNGASYIEHSHAFYQFSHTHVSVWQLMKFMSGSLFLQL